MASENIAVDSLIEKCPAECHLIKAIYAEVDGCCRSCPEHVEGNCLEECLAYRLFRLVPANFDFGGVRNSEA